MGTNATRAGVRAAKSAVRGWMALQRARIAHRRHPGLGELSAECFYATKLRFRDLAFDIGANHGEHTALMLRRGARVVAVEPQAALATELANDFPEITVVRTALSDEPGEALLNLARESDALASLDVTWADHCEMPLTWESREQVPVTTLDELINQYGQPNLVKIDTEGFEHRVLQGLSTPVDHILFEVHAALPDVAAAAFERLELLGHYEYYSMPLKSWLYVGAQGPDEILADLPAMGDVYARRVS
jgi:FkbM family methyltransferase